MLTVLLILTIIAITIPFTSPEALQKEEEGYVSLKNVEYSIQSINDSHVVLNFTLTLEKTGSLKNFTILAKVFDSQTGILLEKRKIGFDDTKKGLNEINSPLAFEKDRSYRVRFEGYRDKATYFIKEFYISGLSSLIPEERKLLLEIKDTDFLIEGEHLGKVKIRMRFYVYSMENYSDVLFHIKTIQLESNLLANESWEKAEIEAGKTLLLETEMDIPASYNYLVKVEAWRNEMLLKKWEFPLKLSPTEIIPEKVKEKEIKLNVSEFVREYPEKYPSEVPTPKPVTQAPGFGALAGILAILVVLTLLTRKKR
jgi:hypothetical protein